MNNTKLTLEWTQGEDSNLGGSGVSSRQLNDCLNEESVALLAMEVFGTVEVSLEETICHLVRIAFHEDMRPSERLQKMAILAQAHLDESR